MSASACNRLVSCIHKRKVNRIKMLLFVIQVFDLILASRNMQQFFVSNLATMKLIHLSCFGSAQPHDRTSYPRTKKYWSFITLPMEAVARYCDEYVCLCLFVCLSVCKDISRTTCAIFTKFFVLVAYVCGLVLPLLRHVDERLHRLSAGRGDRSA